MQNQQKNNQKAIQYEQVAKKPTERQVINMLHFCDQPPESAVTLLVMYDSLTLNKSTCLQHGN